MLSCVIISMACGYPWLPPFVGRLGWGLPLFWLSLPHFAVRWRMLREAPNLSWPDPTNGGGLSRAEGTLWYSLLPSSSDREGVDYHGETSVL